MDALNRAIEIVGGQTALAKLIGTRQAHVWNWLNRDTRVPAEYVLPIERATEGKVTRHDLRPDLYPIEEAPPKSDAAGGAGGDEHGAEAA